MPCVERRQCGFWLASADSARRGPDQGSAGSRVSCSSLLLLLLQTMMYMKDVDAKPDERIGCVDKWRWGVRAFMGGSECSGSNTTLLPFSPYLQLLLLQTHDAHD